MAAWLSSVLGVNCMRYDTLLCSIILHGSSDTGFCQLWVNVETTDYAAVDDGAVDVGYNQSTKSRCVSFDM